MIDLSLLQERRAKPFSPTTILLLFSLAASPIVRTFIVNGFPMLLFLPSLRFEPPTIFPVGKAGRERESRTGTAVL